MADGVLDTHADEDDSDDWGEWSAGAAREPQNEDALAEDVDWAGSDDGAEDGGGRAKDGGGQAEDGGGPAEDGNGQAEDGDGPGKDDGDRAEGGDGQAKDGDGQGEDGGGQAEGGDGQAEGGDSRAKDGDSRPEDNIKKGGWLGDAIPEIPEEDDDWGGWTVGGLQDAKAAGSAAAGPEEDPLKKAADAGAPGGGGAPSKEDAPKKPRMPLSTKAIPTPPRGPPPAHLLAARDRRGMAEYVIDNKELREGTPGSAPTTGLLFRLSKNMDDKGLGCGAPWGTVVMGVDEGDGWLRFSYKGQDCFLPMAVNGKPCLRLHTAAEKQARQAAAGPSPTMPQVGVPAPAGNQRHINPLTPFMMQQIFNTARMRQAQAAQAQAAVPRAYTQAASMPMAWAQRMAAAACYQGGVPFYPPATATSSGWLLPNAGAPQASQPSGAAQGAASVSDNLKKLMAAEEQLKKFVANHRLSPATEKELRELSPGLMLSVIGDTAGMDVLQNGAKQGNEHGAADLAVRARIARLKAELGASACQAGGSGAPPANQGVVVPPRVGPGAAGPEAAAVAPATRWDKKPEEPASKEQAMIKARIEKRGHTLEIAKMILEFVRSHELPNEVEQALLMIPTRHILLIIKNSNLFATSSTTHEKVSAVLGEVRIVDELVYDLVKKVMRDTRPAEPATRKARSRSRSRKDKKHIDSKAAKGRRSPPRRHHSRSAGARGKRRQQAPPPRRRSKSYGRHRRHEKRRRSRSGHSKGRSLDRGRTQAIRHSNVKSIDQVQQPPSPRGDSAPSDRNVKSCQEAAEAEPHQSMEVSSAQVDDSLDAGSSAGPERKLLLPDGAGTSVPEPEDDGEKAVWEWLLQRDGGKGAFLQYFPVLRDEFDCDFSQICAARLTSPISPGTLGFIEPSFFEVLNVKSVGHRLLLAKGILALP